jgi:hypothetical protein
MARELPNNQIRPAAQPVAFFLEPTRRQLAAPAGPLEIPRAPGIEVIQQGSGGNVQGYNAFEQVAQALSPFSQRLTELTGFGMEAYASAEVQRGVNEAMRAKALLDEQQRRSGGEYAAETRRLAQSDPIAALMMDSVNPFRQSGRQRALAQLAGLEVKAAQISAYRNAQGLQSLAPEDPRLAQVKAGAVQEVLKKYGVNEASPGFAQFVLPQINEGGDRVTELHWQDRQGYLKTTIPRTAASEMLGLYVQTLEERQIEFFSPDGRRVVIPAGDPRFDMARSARMGAILDRLVDEAGMPGDVTTMKREAFERLKAIADADGNEELKRLALQVPVGPPDGKSGFREPAVSFFAVESLDSEIKYGEVAYRRAARAQEALAARYQDQLVELTYGVPDGAERLQRIEQLRASPEYQGLSLNQRLELEQKTSTNIDAVTARGRSVEGASALLLDMEGRYGSEWNTAQADGEFQRALASAPEKDRPELRQRYAQIRRRNNDRESSPTSKEVSGVIDRAIKANLLARYPRTVTEAAMRGVDAQQVMAGWADANVAESARRQFSAFQGHARNQIAAEEARRGRPLTAAEATAEATKAISEYGRSDPDAKAYLFPGVGGQPGAGSRPSAAPSAPGAAPPRPGTKPFAGRVYPSGQLDNIPDRPGRASSWRSQPVLDAQSVVQEANRIIGGGMPSAALRRFARDAGTTPGELLNRHLDYYRDSLEVPAADRQRLLRDGRQSQAVRNSSASVASSGSGSPVARAGAMLMDLLMGTRPATAAQRQPQLRSAVGLLDAPRAAGGEQQVATRSTVPAGPAIESQGLDRLATGRLVAAPEGRCVTAVLLSMHANGLDPRQLTTSLDQGNNPRGLASQLANVYGWKPLPGLGTPRTLSSPYGAFTVNQLTLGEYQAAVSAGRVPSGAIVFQTKRDWAGAHPGSRGFDAAIARDGGRSLWNGSMSGSAIYGSATRQVFVMVPGDARARGRAATSRR